MDLCDHQISATKCQPSNLGTHSLCGSLHGNSCTDMLANSTAPTIFICSQNWSVYMYMLRPDSQPDRLWSWLTQFMTKIDLLTHFKTKRHRGWERAQCHTAQVYMCCSNSTAVLVLDKAKPWSPSPELQLNTQNSQQWHLCWDCQRVTEPTEYVLYSSDSSPASCWIKLSSLPSSLWSPSSTEQRAPHILCTERCFFTRMGALSSTVLAVNV